MTPDIAAEETALVFTQRVGDWRKEKYNFICSIYDREQVAIFCIKYISIGKENVKMTVI